MTHVSDYDVAVVGAGPAGSAATLVLARAGFSTVLVESTGYQHMRPGETLPPSARTLLARLGLWEPFTALEAAPSHGNRSAWGSPELAESSFIFHPHGQGWHVDRGRFDQAMAQTAVAAGAHWQQDTQVTDCIPLPDGRWQLELGNGGRLCARAVIDSTGRNARIARRLGARRVLHDHLIGVAAQYHAPHGGKGYTLVEAAEHGWWYSAPVPPDRHVVMFMTDADICRRLGRANARVWDQSLAEAPHTLERIAGCQRISAPTIFSAVSQRLARIEFTSPWLACGDAALGVDPLSASGIIRAMRSGEGAGQAIAHWLLGRADIARAYERLLDDDFAEYLAQRAAHYTIEQRWPSSPFWNRRHQTTPLYTAVQQTTLHE